MKRSRDRFDETARELLGAAFRSAPGNAAVARRVAAALRMADAKLNEERNLRRIKAEGHVLEVARLERELAEARETVERMAKDGGR